MNPNLSQSSKTNKLILLKQFEGKIQTNTCKLSSTCRARPAKFFQPLTDCLVKRKNDPCFRVFAKTEEDRYIGLTEVRSVEPVLSSFLMTSLNFLDRLPFVDGDFLHQCDHLNFFGLEH